MSNTRLLDRLRDLHDELVAINDDLSAPDQIDDGTVDALGDLVTDIARLAERANELKESDANPPPEADAPRHHDLSDRIQQFEKNHPRVVQFLSELSDLLGMMGI